MTDLVPFRAGPWSGWLASELVPGADRAQLRDPEALARRAEARAAGRGQTLRVPLSDDPACRERGMLRRYLHGGLLGRVTGASFLGSRSKDEVRVLQELRRRGAPCPEPLAAYQRQILGPFRELYLLTREIPGARAAPEVFRSLPRDQVRRRRQLLRQLARAVRRFHDAGGIHPDLNARNLVLDDRDGAWVLDLDRGAVATRAADHRVRRANLRRLARSWRKLDPLGEAVSKRDALAFARAYAGGRLRGLPEGLLAPRARDPAGTAYRLLGTAFSPLLPLLLPLWKATARSWRERLVRRLPPSLPGGRPLVLHGASVGEVSSMPPLVRELRQRFPGVPILVTTLSESGQARARQLGIADAVGYLPADLGPYPGRWLDALAPRLVILLETELWPGLYRGLRRRGIPVATAAMRIAPNRVERYQRFGSLFRPLFQIPDYLGVQTLLDRSRVLLLGAPEGRVRLSGDLKFDQVFENLHHPGRAALEPVLRGEGPRLVFGSVHPEEDAMVLDILLRLRERHPEVRATVAPRHLQKVPRIEKLLQERGLAYRKRSETRGPVEEPVLLLDTHGELALCYEGARAAFVGGSLVPVGGHSPLEPAVFQVPVLFGPRAFNFQDMNDRLVSAGGAERVENGESLLAALGLLISDPEEARRRGAAAQALARSLGGAAERTARHLQERWPELV